MCLPKMLPSTQKLMPRHQQLIAKCYPRLPKNSTADAVPNSSELAYLLYYASTRQEKLPKVGAYLEKITTQDVSHWQSARVLVTLQILTAMLEHAEIQRPQSFAMLAPTVLRIIRGIIINTNDISLMEATTGLWDVFTQWQDCLALAADSEYRALFDEVVQLYGTLAENTSKKLAKSTQAVAQHDAIRIRKVGVTAFKSLFMPANMERSWNTRFNKSFAAVLTNLRSERESYVSKLHLLGDEADEEKERIKAANRRQSMATARTFSHDEPESDPRAAEGTAQDADRLQEEEVGLLTLECIQAIFQSDHPAQIRGGAIAYMKFVDDESRRSRTGATALKETSLLFRLITTWTTVQHRFIVLVIAVEHLYRLPLDSNGIDEKTAGKGGNLDLHETYIDMINGVLRADLNLIGLSVMDVMLRLLDHIIRLATMSVRSGGQTEKLIGRMRDCIALLAVHVYYADQVRDMIAAILIRVKAYPIGTGRNYPTDAAAPKAAANGSTDDTEPSSTTRPITRERPASTKSTYFTSDEARQVALEMVATIIEFANSQNKTATGSTVSNRHRVPVGVWEGTQWLLRDTSEEVRNAYRTALRTWARYESDEANEDMLDFDAEDCIGRLVEKARPAASIRGSVGHSHQSHPQLLMLPYPADRQLSSSRNSSSGTAERSKPRVTAKDLDDIMNGRRKVPLRVQLTDSPGPEAPLDMKSVLATLSAATARPKREPMMSAPPY